VTVDLGNYVSAVLVGGASRRMGVDKALIDLEGVPLGRRVAGALGVDDGRTVLACGGSAEVAHSLGLEHLPDEAPGSGPLLAIATVLRAFPGSDTIVAACDLGGLDRATVMLFEQWLSDEPHDVVVASAERRQPMLARWRQSALPIIDQVVGAGERSMYGALAQLQVAELRVDAAATANLNTPQDLECWRRSCTHR
jgi:molybdopterin-guanine dinucleotide biosynthesis protein A